MKRLCLMALSLVLFSFSAFAWGGINNNNEVLIGGSPKAFPDEVNVGETAACLKDITLVATKTYVIKGTLDLNGKYLTASGANIILASGGSIVNTGYDQGKIIGANIFCETGTTINYNNLALEGCTMFSRTASGMATTIAPSQWNFIGLYDNTDLQAFSSVSNESNKVWALQYDYENGDWDNNYCTSYSTHFDQGEGVFVYPEHQTTVPFTVTSTTQAVSITKTIKVTQVIPAHSGGSGNKADNKYYIGWFALANPFTESIDVASLISGINTQGSYTLNSQSIQGGCVYTYNGGTWAMRTGGSILPGQGFFLDLFFTESSSVSSENPTVTLQHSWTNTSSKAPSRDFLTVSVSTDGYKVPVMFAQNDMATEGYDIYDANKMFGSGSVAEPYLVCNGIELCKEEVSSANYTATMNIKSSESRSVEIVADNIPEGYSLTLLDGAVEMEMSEGDVYTTDITEGENADRFKLLITKNNVSIVDVAEAESIRVVNNNRTISIYGGNDVRTEVYNALGQKVYETSDRVFDLNNVVSGAYILKVSDGKTVNSTKIVVE
ncbi:MAG: T9SS type A sorting domain-containing protein [Candidatus Onthomorpha sp.]|nr:T9SS type A sorting domain-containing protein [Candidatus Onthomorpha sp.]